tara:strand:- start:144 stop:476 length:333 start_codon:yes stop_codon:yes gene_type:complete
MEKFTKKNYKQVIQKDKVGVIIFSSSFCHLCDKLKPIIKKLEEQYHSIDFYTCDVNQEEELTKLLVKDDGVPTGFVVKNKSIFKIKDPKESDDKSWYSKKYLTEIIEALL